MKYSIKVNEVRTKEGSNIKGFATVVFGDSFKITNIAILENKDKGELFVSMPRYRSNERDESNGVIYKDVCNPITAEFREELYSNILDAYARIKEPKKEETQKQDRTQEMPEFSVTVTVRRHIVVGAKRILFSTKLPTRLCRTGTYRRFLTA